MNTNTNVCSPTMNVKKTCFTLKQLKNIASSINKYENRLAIHKRGKKTDIWNEINSYFSVNMNCHNRDEVCWMKQPLLNLLKSDLNKEFIPEKPNDWKHNERTWLTNIDIYNVCDQYQRKYRSFDFIGVFPIDYNYKNTINQCIVQELCVLNISNMIKHKKTQLGIVFNLDKHYDPGSHWVSVYVGLNPKAHNYGFFYFDSNAVKPPKEIYILFENIKLQIMQIHKKNFELHVNDVQKQYKNTECGMFSIHFILSCLKKKKWIDIKNEQVFDDDVFKLRNLLFR